MIARSLSAARPAEEDVSFVKEHNGLSLLSVFTRRNGELQVKADRCQAQPVEWFQDEALAAAGFRAQQVQPGVARNTSVPF